jgi:hypothetical protein
MPPASFSTWLFDWEVVVHLCHNPTSLHCHLCCLQSRALRCRHAGSVTLALRCLSYMVTLPLPGMAASSVSAGKGVTQLLERVPDSSHPLALESFRLLAGLLRGCAAYQPTTPQVCENQLRLHHCSCTTVWSYVPAHNNRLT